MHSGLADDIQQSNDARKTVVMDKELSRLGTVIACLQETRLADSSLIREANYTFFWQGLPQDDPRQHSVGFTVKNSLIPAIEPPTGRSETILALRLSTSTGFTNVFCIYAPTLCATPEVRDQFCEPLDEMISRNLNTEGLYLLGDFNARMGADCDTWPSCLGKMNENDSGCWNCAATPDCA
ncbi:unnamed protein product [Acanthosepion pharaonis]|uniref:Endonuclease/exonuclease/phosphatase domain-containing protein n=1 Tax=Acanthosepion pharaonis TaxID=158019 RepID=A0A812EEW5_ACAPH|nr:unnamed protein product [Sepia pharaonis]